MTWIIIPITAIIALGFYACYIIYTLNKSNFSPTIKNKFYYNGDDCPFKTDLHCEEFLEWVWDNRKRIEFAFRDWQNVFVITTPYILGGYMFIVCWENGIELSTAKDKYSFDHSHSKVTYCPNWGFVSTGSKRMWLKVY